MFPSAIEGFPFGVLEMLAAGLPVVAYRVPGPSAILASEYLVPLGDREGIALRLLSLLENPARLAAARTQAIARAAEFSWDDIARRTAARYELELR
ncbi:MAG: glycosyltransferase [Pedosphaera sp.]|nr:glycosyltransferase [Pedosphaera sp.]